MGQTIRLSSEGFFEVAARLRSARRDLGRMARTERAPTLSLAYSATLMVSGWSA